MGVDVNEYKRMYDFKARVLENAIDEINNKTDLKVSYEQVKKGRIIVGFKFTVLEKLKKELAKDNLNRDSDTPDLFHSLTDKQVDLFSSKLANDSSFGSKYGKHGEDMKGFERRIKEELTDVNNQQKWLSDLMRVGYSIKN